MSNNTPKVSIVLPCYNVEKWIDRCLESIRKQTFTAFEVICVNDGSTDGTLQALTQWGGVE